MAKKSFLKSARFAILISLLFDGCDKSEDPEPLPCLLTSWATTDSQFNSNKNQVEFFTYTYTFVYDNQKVVSSTLSSQLASGGDPASATFTCSYNKAGDLSEIHYPNYREAFTYTNGEITKKEMLSNSNALEDQTDYEYSNGRLSKIQEYNFPSGSTKLAKDAYTTFEYATSTDKNPARSKYFSSATSTTPDYAYEYTFSDQKSEFAAVPAAFLKYLRLTGASQETTATKIIVTYSTGTHTHNYTYEFNANGFPTKKIDNYSGVSDPITTTYSYNCN